MRFWNEECESKPVEAMRALQAEKLRETVAWVYERIPLYRQQLDEKGVKSTDVRTIEHIRHLPFTVKHDLRDQYPFGLCAVPVQDLVRVHASSGTTGTPITGPYTVADLDQWTECMARSLWAQGIRLDDICQNAYGLGLFTGGLGFCLGIEKIGSCLVPTGTGMTERQIMLMQDFGSTALFCTPTYALTLAEKAEQLGVDLRRLPLRVGSFGAEPWTIAMRQEIEARMGIVAHEVYGLTEMMGPGVGFSCEAFRLHLNEDHIYPEIIDPSTLEPLPLGEQGELVLTALQRRAMPLLRYRTRDITTLRRVACECGRTLMVMDKILGRSDDMLIISGVNVFPSQVESILMEYAEMAPLYQLRVVQKGHLSALHVEAEAKADVYAQGQKALEALGTRIATQLHSVIGIHMPVGIVPPGTIARSEGKARRVVDERREGLRN
ncbi:MAG: phenylacetate--CoA ligase [Candidatus Tectomicrobia bacterium]|nr:phenylacetate--CoA ligase [Candidatus Tectomicrobia bacterium]